MHDVMVMVHDVMVMHDVMMVNDGLLGWRVGRSGGDGHAQDTERHCPGRENFPQHGLSPWNS